MKSQLSSLLNKSGAANDKASYEKYQKSINDMIKKIKDAEMSKYDKLGKFYTSYYSKNK